MDGIVEITGKRLFLFIGQTRFDFDFYEYRCRDYRTGARFNDTNIAGCEVGGFIDHIADGVGKYVNTLDQQHVVDTALEQHTGAGAAAASRFGGDLNDVFIPPADQRPALPF